MDLGKRIGLCCTRVINREFPNPLHIITGYVRKALKGTKLANHEIEHLSKLRMDICKSCIVKNQKCLSNDNVCCECGCDMEAKTRVVPAHCPKSNW